MEVVVNGKVIGEQEIARETQYHPARSFEVARQAAVRAIVVRELLLQAAANLGLGPDDAGPIEESETPEEATIRALIERHVKTPEADEEACRRYYQKNQSKFCSPDLMEARHILLMAAPDDEPGLESQRQQAVDAIAMLQKSPAKFGDLAKELSACPSGKQGGFLGQITRGETVPELETILLSLEEGQLCPVPVRTRYGYHVVRLERRISGERLPFDAVHDSIRAYLEERVWRHAVRQFIQLLIGEAEIEGVNLEGTVSPLVQ